jgi:hypothetical protein
MRMGRLLAEEGAVEACYHCVTRVVERRFAFGDREKERFVEILWAYEEFCGVRVLRFCIMGGALGTDKRYPGLMSPCPPRFPGGFQ